MRNLFFLITFIVNASLTYALTDSIYFSSIPLTSDINYCKNELTNNRHTDSVNYNNQKQILSTHNGNFDNFRVDDWNLYFDNNSFVAAFVVFPSNNSWTAFNQLRNYIDSNFTLTTLNNDTCKVVQAYKIVNSEKYFIDLRFLDGLCKYSVSKSAFVWAWINERNYGSGR